MTERLAIPDVRDLVAVFAKVQRRAVSPSAMPTAASRARRAAERLGR